MHIRFKMCSEKQRQLFDIVTGLWTELAVHRDSIPNTASNFYHLFCFHSSSGFHTVPLQVNWDPITYPHIKMSLRILEVVPSLCQ